MIIDAIIALVPGVQVTVFGDYPDYTIDWISPSTAPVTNEQINEQYLKMVTKDQAKSLLSATDWTEVPSVSDTTKSPHLTNVSEFVAYRDALRALAVNPVANPVWPTLPAEVWS
jgi:hypothetical protein